MQVPTAPVETISGYLARQQVDLLLTDMVQCTSSCRGVGKYGAQTPSSALYPITKTWYSVHSFHQEQGAAPFLQMQQRPNLIASSQLLADRYAGCQKHGHEHREGKGTGARLSVINALSFQGYHNRDAITVGTPFRQSCSAVELATLTRP